MRDFNGYISLMEKSLGDKLFFLEKIDLNKYDCVLDFGCANGKLINSICDGFQDIQFVGYDKSEMMINLAKKEAKLNTFFGTNFEQIKSIIDGKKYVVIFSSVLHEIEKNEYDFVINIMQNSSAVVIRDMYFDISQNCAFDTKILKNYDKNDHFVLNFEQFYGKIDNLLNLYHYFLKYAYTQNWDYEVQENYFGIDYKKIFDSLENFKILYDEKFILEYKKQQVEKDFGYTLKIPTHRKIILIKRGEKC